MKKESIMRGLIQKISIAICFSSLLSCGGGGSEGDGEVSVGPLLTGKFIDGPVSGMYFETSSHSGVTDGAGNYQYRAGEDITFYIGNLRLPPLPGSALITPADYTPLVDDPTYPSIVNLLRLLQSLDTDLNHANGIQLPESLELLRQSQQAENLRFDTTVEEFESSLQVTELLAENSLSEMIDEEIAVINFQPVLDELLDQVIDAAANDTEYEPGMPCTSNGEVSPYPCIPGTGPSYSGIAVGEIYVRERSGGPAPFTLSPRRRLDALWADNNYLENLHKLASIFDDTYDIRDFAGEANVGIVNFVTTDPNPNSLLPGWSHTELKLDNVYVGTLPYAYPPEANIGPAYTSDRLYNGYARLQDVEDRCGLLNGSYQLILSPGTYSWNADAYESSFCNDVTGQNPDCTGQWEYTPVWNWPGGQFEIGAGECIVISATGGPAVASQTSIDGDVYRWVQDDRFWVVVTQSDGIYGVLNFVAEGGLCEHISTETYVIGDNGEVFATYLDEDVREEYTWSEIELTAYFNTTLSEDYTPNASLPLSCPSTPNTFEQNPITGYFHYLADPEIPPLTDIYGNVLSQDVCTEFNLNNYTGGNQYSEGIPGQCDVESLGATHVCSGVNDHGVEYYAYDIIAESFVESSERVCVDLGGNFSSVSSLER